MVNTRNLLLLVFLTLLAKAIIAQDAPKLGDAKANVRESLIWNSKNINASERRDFNHDSASSVIENGDTLVYRVSDVSETEYAFIFSKDTCVAIHIKFSCFVCFKKRYKRWLFPGKWRQDENGYLYRRRKLTRAYIKRLNGNCVFPYEVSVTTIEDPISKEAWQKMEKVKKKWIGTRKYLLPQ